MWIADAICFKWACSNLHKAEVFMTDVSSGSLVNMLQLRLEKYADAVLLTGHAGN